MNAIPLCRAPVGSVIRVQGTDTYARVVSIGVGSVTVAPGNGVNTTYWSRASMVVVMQEAPESPAPALKPDRPAKPQENVPEAPTKPRKRLKLAGTSTAPAEAPETSAAPQKPKGGGKDIFGVKVGSAASAANAILLRLKKDVTPEMCVKEDRTLVVSNVRSHFKRMANDGLIKMRAEGEGKTAVLYFSIKGTK